MERETEKELSSTRKGGSVVRVFSFEFDFLNSIHSGFNMGNRRTSTDGLAMSVFQRPQPSALKTTTDL